MKLLKKMLQSWKAVIQAASSLFGIRKTEKKAISDPENFRKILIPNIRNIHPGLIARDIIGVQPMSGPLAQIFSMIWGEDSTKVIFKNVTRVGQHWNVQIICPGLKGRKKMFAWIYNNMDNTDYWIHDHEYNPNILWVNIYNEEALLAFKLAWENAPL
jgi:hypothetical protein